MKDTDQPILYKDGVSYVLPFILVTCCFALWGFANDITNPMVKAFSKIFRMSVTDGALVQVAFYGGYFAMAFHQTYDNYLQLFPLILLFGLKLGGIRGNFGWKRLFTFIVLSVVLTQLVVNGLKLTTGVLRPDATNYFSFPSGHTAAAFMAATLLYKEYGFKGYWIGLVAYAAAIVTGFTRILNNRHWLFDVIIGAALGILLTDLAFRLVQLIFKDRGLIQHK